MSAELRAARFGGDAVLERCRTGSATLRPGDRGAAVNRVQQALMDLGYVLREFGPDGVFGAETAAAVATFNADTRLGVEGVVGSGTIAALDERFASEPPEPLPSATTRATPVPVERARLTADAVVAAARRVADIALAQAAAGAHFLRGAAGATPGGNDGTAARPGGVALAPARTDPVAPVVFAADCASEGSHRCAGRFDARNGGIAGGRPARATDTDLIVYLARLAALPEDRWSPFFRFFSPRRSGDAHPGGRVVWGEDCRGRRHFDGPGLVNWCVEQALGPASVTDFDAAAWASEGSGTEAVPIDDAPRSGDILVRVVDGAFTHIGVLAGDRVVLAEQPSVGVVTRRFTPAGWTLRRRLSAATG